MKVKIAYLQSEEFCAGVIERFVCKVLRNVKVHKSERYEPYRHIYISDVQGGGKTKKDPDINP